MAQMQRVVRTALLRAHVPLEAAAKRTFNAFRRFLPTAAQLMNLEPSLQQAVRNWQDIHGGGGASAVTKALATCPMGRHYAGSPELVSVMVKRTMWEHL